MSNENKSTGVAIANSVYQSPMSAALMSKMVSAPVNTAGAGLNTTKAAAEASMGELHAASSRIQRAMRDAENMYSLFPDISLSSQIVVSALLAPNNMFSQELNYGLEHPFVPQDVAALILEKIREQIDNHYELTEDLYDIAERALFKEGSVVRLVLPEAAVDHLINNPGAVRFESAQTVEQIMEVTEMKTVGFLGPAGDDAPKVRFENFASSMTDKIDRTITAKSGPWEGMKIEGIEFSDNFNLLKQASLTEASVNAAVRSMTSLTPDRATTIKTRLENFGLMNPNVSDSEFKSALFKTPNLGQSLFVRVPERDNLRRHSIGRPLYRDVPPEAVIPVHYPDDPTKQAGAFFIIDKNGYYLTKESQRRYIGAAQTAIMTSTSNVNSTSNNNTTSQLLAKAKSNISGENDHVPLTYLAEIFGAVFDEDAVSRIRNGIMGLEAAIASNNDAFQILIARSLAGQTTQVVFVPKQYFTYFAFQYNPDGTGRSMMEDVANLLSLRAVSLYAKIANQVRNAISITEVTVDIDKRDNNPQKALEMIKDIVSRTRTQFFPWGLNTPADISNWWHSAGFQFNIAAHPKLPETKITYESKSHDKNVPDIDSDEKLEDMVHMNFGVTPEMRDAGKGAEFATSIANSNILFSKRMHRLQKKYNRMLTDHIHVITLNDQVILKEIRDIIDEQWGQIEQNLEGSLKTIAANDVVRAKEEFLREVVEHVFVTLPSPEITKLDQQVEAFRNYKEALDAGFDAVLSDDALAQQVLGEAHATLVAYKEPMKAQMLREWMQRENFLPEVFDLVAIDDKKEGASESMSSMITHYKNIATNVNKFMKDFAPAGVAIVKDLNEATGATGPDGVTPLEAPPAEGDDAQTSF